MNVEPENAVSLRDFLDCQIAALRSELAAQKELLETKDEATAQALIVARAELERRLEGLNELRKDVVNDRSQFVKADVYFPAHKELERQRTLDAEKITMLNGDVKNNATEIAGMKSSLTWLTRLIIGALILAIIAWVFQRIGR